MRTPAKRLNKALSKNFPSLPDEGSGRRVPLITSARPHIARLAFMLAGNTIRSVSRTGQGRNHGEVWKRGSEIGEASDGEVEEWNAEVRKSQEWHSSKEQGPGDCDWPVRSAKKRGEGSEKEIQLGARITRWAEIPT